MLIYLFIYLFFFFFYIFLFIFLVVIFLLLPRIVSCPPLLLSFCNGCFAVVVFVLVCVIQDSLADQPKAEGTFPASD